VNCRGSLCSHTTVVASHESGDKDQYKIPWFSFPTWLKSNVLNVLQILWNHKLSFIPHLCMRWLYRAIFQECVILEDELHGARFSNSKKIQIWSFKKNQKYQSVVNELVYLCINFHHEIPYILPSVKITKLQIWEHEQYHFQIFQILSNLSFFLSLNYKVFCIQTLHTRIVRSWLHPDNFFRFFLKLLHVDFEKI
jgi:hypothetical protein